MLRVYEQIFTDEDALAAYSLVQSGMLSSGEKVLELESKFAKICDRKYALACSSGTAALSLALYGLSLSNKHIAIPACSFAATAFAAFEQNNEIVFIDADQDTWNLDINHLERVCEKNQIDCVIAVHNYGNPYDYDKLKQLAEKHRFTIIEDACEGLCASYGNQPAGKLGDMSVFSLYGNKLISCGEGGIVLTDSRQQYDKMHLYRGQGQDPNRRFWHLIKAFNFRMTNLQAAVGLSQMSRIEHTQNKKLEILEAYKEHLPSHVKLQTVLPKAKHSWWMVSVLGDAGGYYADASLTLLKHGIETRPIFPPLPNMPAFNDITSDKFAVAELLHDRGITLPSGPGTSLDDVKRVCSLL